MLKTILAGTTALAIAGGGLAIAQSGPRTDGPRWHRNAEDAGAMADARIAALKAALRLTPEQEKSWPAFETALRDLAKQRADRISQRRTDGNAPRPDVVERMHRAADALSTRGAGLKKLGDAADPLYKSLDESQKRRFAALLPMRGDGSAERHGRRFGEARGFNDSAQQHDHRGHHGRDWR
jgi:zinc resistance-associated protein